MKIGKVYLTGAGPGDPKLITLRAMELLKAADTVIYDRLVNEKILEYIPGSAEIIFAGKEPGNHTMSQNEINCMIVTKAKEGKTVVRLKGGDPFVFGRGAEEALILAHNGIPFEIVPGISSAIAVPAYAGIPVTCRNYASSFHVLTGHKSEDKGENSINWDEVGKFRGTLIILMGLNNLKYISDRLILSGQPPERPTAVICSGTTLKQRTITSTLGSISKDVEELNISDSSVIIIGETVLLGNELMWFEKKLLWGKKIIVTRPKERACALSEELEELGADVIRFPVIRIEPALNDNEFELEMSRLDGYKWLIFTSVNGVETFFTRLKQLSVDIRKLGNIKICAIGPVTQKAIEDKGLIADYCSREYRSEGIADVLNGVIKPGEFVLVPRAERGRNVLEELLNALDAKVRILPMYHTLMEEIIDGKVFSLIKQNSIDWLTFTSPSCVVFFMKILQSHGFSGLRMPKIACIGPITAEAVGKMGIPVDVTAEEYTAHGIVEGIMQYYRDREG